MSQKEEKIETAEESAENVTESAEVTAETAETAEVEETPASVAEEPTTEESSATAPKSKKKKTIVIAAVLIAVLLVGAGVGYYFLTADSRTYNSAIELYQAGDYENAKTAFLSISDYENAAEMAEDCQNAIDYATAMEMYQNEQYEEALKTFTDLGEYESAAEMVEKCEYEMSTDRQFIKSLAAGLMKRWDKLDENEAQGLADEDPELYAEYCDIETDALKDYRAATFNDAELGEKAKDYINSVASAKLATNYYTSNYIKFLVDWDDAYNRRASLIYDFVNDYGLTVDETYQEALKSMVDAGQAAKKSENVLKIVEEMCKGFTITAGYDSWGLRSYKLNMKNTTDFTFDYFYANVNALDANGVIVDSAFGDEIQSWKPDQEVSIDIYFSNTNIDPDTYTFEYTPHYQSGNYYS